MRDLILKLLNTCLVREDGQLYFKCALTQYTAAWIMAGIAVIAIHPQWIVDQREIQKVDSNVEQHCSIDPTSDERRLTWAF